MIIYVAPVAVVLHVVEWLLLAASCLLQNYNVVHVDWFACHPIATTHIRLTLPMSSLQTYGAPYCHVWEAADRHATIPCPFMLILSGMVRHYCLCEQLCQSVPLFPASNTWMAYLLRTTSARVFTYGYVKTCHSQNEDHDAVYFTMTSNVIFGQGLYFINYHHVHNAMSITVH